MLAKSTFAPARTDFLKLLAACAMLIDHSALLPIITEPQLYLTMRLIGRISFPIFAFYIAVGFLHTRDLKKYVQRLFVFALLSQVPFALYFQDWRTLNILFTFLIAIAMMWFFEQKWYYAAVLVSFVPWCTDILLGITTDYSTYGVLTVFIFYYFMKEKQKTAAAFVLLTTLQCVFSGNYVQLAAVFALPLIYFTDKVSVRLGRYFFYVFYPGHILLLYTISLAMRGI